MQSVSADWKAAQQLNFVPESYVEISYRVTDPDADADASASATNNADISKVSQTIDNGTHSFAKYASLEHNIWGLNGSFPIYTNSMQDTGYVSSVVSGADCAFVTRPVITISFTRVFTNPIAGVSIDWSNAFNEYASEFTITAYANGTQTAQLAVTGNTNILTVNEFTISSYDTIEIEVIKWCKPNRRCRIEQIVCGVIKVFTRGDLLGFDFSESSDLMSLELPKNEIVWKINNVDSAWNPDNQAFCIKPFAHAIALLYG